jgi:hypothetical protein
MAKNKIIGLALLLPLMVACIFGTASGIPGLTPKSTATAGSSDFSARATSPQSILLTWKAVDGATGYNLEYGWNGKDFHPLVQLSASQAQYEDFTAIPGVTQSYRLQSITAAGAGEWLRADATTPAASPHPLTVTPTYDDAHTVSATIGKAGGSISLTDSGGVRYKLDIPAGALSADTQVQLVPLSGMDGWPLDGERLAAVGIEPGGLKLAEVATLSITLRSAGKPNLATVGFAFQSMGTEFHLQPLPSNQAGKTSLQTHGGQPVTVALQTGRVITLPVIELRGNGIGQGSTGAITDLARNDPPTDASAAVEQQQAAADASDNNLVAPLVGAPPPSNDPNRDAAVRLEKDMVKIWEEIDKANDGDALEAAMQQFREWDRDTHGLTPDQYASLTSTFWDDLTSKFMKLLDKAAEDCKNSSGTPPPVGVVPLQGMLDKTLNPPSSDSQWSVFKSKMTSSFGEDVLGKAWFNLKQGVCGSFNVIKPIGAEGTICSLARPFTTTEKAPGGIVTNVEYFPLSMTKGLVHVHMTIAAMGASFTGVGPYEVVFYSPTEANIQIEWTGVYSQPGITIPAAKQPPIHYDIGHIIAPDCP